MLDWNLPLDAPSPCRTTAAATAPPNSSAAAAAEALKPALEARWVTRCSVADMTSGLHAIRRVPGGWQGAADPRREGSAQGR
ncbi:MAG: hypothetical protein MZW92_28715 [Comamonadaceae bacterium]|nr:hypothetical protein [Comamonadaceae bacterium]